MRTHLSLFSGIGGLDIAAEWAGFTTVGQCEWADYPQAVLQRHWPNVPKWRDIRTLTGANFYEQTGLQSVDLISGGFPCQPFSVAGHKRGTSDDRYLWPEMCRVIRELKPTWVCGENVPNIVNLALDQVLTDLENEGYETATLIIPACGVGAWHKRERVAVLGYSRRGGCRGSKRGGYGSEFTDGLSRSTEPRICRVDDGLRTAIHETDTDTDSDFKPRSGNGQVLGGQEIPSQSPGAYRSDPLGHLWENEPDVGRVAHGIPNRMDRVKCLGNAVVPQAFYPIFKAISEVMDNED